MSEWKKFWIILGVFLTAYFMPVNSLRFQGAIIESFAMLNDYAREHVLLCLVPAFFIAGAVAVFISQDAVIKYFGPTAKKWVAYSVAAVSGTILAVCSCTILPLFAGIYKKGAGLGPATAFLYSGPAINILAIVITARVLGPELGIARALGAVVFSVVIGYLMHLIFLKEEKENMNKDASMFAHESQEDKPLWKTGIYFFSMVGVLVFANWGRPMQATGLWATIFSMKWILAAGFLAVVLYASVKWFNKEERDEWFSSTWGFAKQILPLLFFGVLVAGVLLGRPGHEGLIPSAWVERLVGGNSIGANLFASVAGAFMYFATLTEVPILQGLIGSGMGKGPALALLLAGPALSLPNMLVIRQVMGTKKTVVFVCLVVIMATLAGVVYGTLF
ncbi:permease [Geosporobacter ferrireducens]|uniref:Permease n=1 Tax=Geosporobacter ferrireducens TaxID=1424294 RepID=A0A1D8GE98_9FIRM|nr:permease [Geosporobacter ferrireducens]AOT69232.1 permease [Geosporobacter ferrireducens]